MTVARQHGFTLLEVIVTMAIAALLMTMIGPSVGRSVTNARARSVAQQFVADMNWVRNQASTTSRPAGGRPTLQINSDCSWAPTNISGSTAAVLAAHSMTAAYLTANVNGFSCTLSAAAPFVVVFNEQGFVSPPPASSANSGTVTFTAPNNGTTWTVQIMSSGSAILSTGAR